MGLNNPRLVQSPRGSAFFGARLIKTVRSDAGVRSVGARMLAIRKS
jgi:hypothetical protein